MIMKKEIYIFGSGISGATIARLYADNGYLVHIYEILEHIGGNCFDYFEDNICVHKYGPHIFHTPYDDVWEFVNRFTKFNNYKNKVNLSLKQYENPISFPINFKSIEEMFDKQKASLIIQNLKQEYPNAANITILELLKSKNKVLANFSDFVFNNVYKNYTIKMWGIDSSKIDEAILQRVRINLDYSDNYFPNDKYQGIPINGYTGMIKNMLDHPNIKLTLNFDFNKRIQLKNNSVYLDNNKIETKVYYSGSIDELFNYCYSSLEYRSLNIVFEKVNKNRYQNVGVINYPQHQTMTRITEYKYFLESNNNHSTIISKEYPGNWNKDDPTYKTRFYPINNQKSNKIHKQYLELANSYNIIPLGRLANYKYFDMDDAIKNAFEIFNQNR